NYDSSPDLRSNTQTVFAERENELLDTGAAELSYMTIGEIPKLKEVIVPFKLVLQGHAKIHLQRQESVSMSEVLHAFKQKHGRFLNHLVREFELKKNAWQTSRSSESKMGVLNLTKMHQYKYNDDLFKKITNVPQGKNHGMVMVIDLSGSMGD